MGKLTDWLLFFVLAVAVSLPVFADDDDNVIDEVVWVVGDEAIYKSEVEEQYRQMQYDGQRMQHYGLPCWGLYRRKHHHREHLFHRMYPQ